MKKLHLICNAHIDPIWLWEWEEGAAAAISTFRSAANLADTFDYVFCHNEATLYQWVKEYEPELFDKIAQLIQTGRWHVMGGWYLQPDCNMPSGEAMVRQVLVGKRYFSENFNACPTTAVNVDPFGHSFGLVQILKKSGFDGYLFCRPSPDELDLHEDFFLWKGPDGSEIRCFRASKGYNSPMGEAIVKIKKYLEENADQETGMLLWGVGNHGGGPSTKDLSDIREFILESDIEIVHSTPENYFKDAGTPKVVFAKSLYPSMVGCYSSQVRIKQAYRLLENTYFMVEKMCTVADSLRLMDYPVEELDEVQRNMLNAQFHDILPGSSIKEGENTGLRLMDHGLELLSRIRAKAFFALCEGQEKTKPGEYSILVFNPHPYAVNTEIECEFQLEDQNWSDSYITSFQVFSGEELLPSQLVKESSNLNLDWRKRILFHCTLSPLSMNRFDCRPVKINARPSLIQRNEDIVFDNGTLRLMVNHNTGLLDSIRFDGRELTTGNAFNPVILQDTVDPWAMTPPQRICLGEQVDSFLLMSEEEATDFLDLPHPIPSVRIIEDGDVATSVEAVFHYHHSYLVVNYVFFKKGNTFDVDYTVFWNEKSKALKISIPTPIVGNYTGETIFASEVLPHDGREVPSQRWSSLSDGHDFFGIINNGTYASSCMGSEVQLTLLRSPCYAAHPILGRKIIPEDRYVPRSDQGEHHFHFKVCIGMQEELADSISLKAQILNESPYALNIFPKGTGVQPDSFMKIGNDAVLLSALKKSGPDEYIVRLFNSSENPVSTSLEFIHWNCCRSLHFTKFEVKTLKFKEGVLTETMQLEI